MKLVSVLISQFLFSSLLATSVQAVTMQEAIQAIKNVDSLVKADAFLAKNPNTMYRKALSEKELYALTERECTDSDGNKVFEYNDRGYPASDKYAWNSHGQITRWNNVDWQTDYTYNGDGFLIKEATKILETGSDRVEYSYVDSYSRDDSNLIQSRIRSGVPLKTGKEYEHPYKYEYRPFYGEYCVLDEQTTTGDYPSTSCYHIDTDNIKVDWRQSKISWSGGSIYSTVSKKVFGYDQYGYLTLIESFNFVGSKKGVDQHIGEYKWQEEYLVSDVKCSNQYQKRKFKFI